MSIQKFEELNINDYIKKAIQELNYVEPTPIQSRAIPFVLTGRDVIGQAQTGTGKTAAFTIPLLELIDHQSEAIQALILCPTRELAIQVTKEIRKLNQFIEGSKVVPVYGGQSYDIQIRALKKHPQIIVGTPGRLIDLMDRSLIKLHNIKMVILDEADEMLKMGFQDDLEKILETTPSNRQTVMFSATMPDAVLRIANNYLNNYELIQVEKKTMTVEKIDQSYFIVKNDQKVDLLIRLLDYHNFNSSIVFCNTKKDVDQLVLELQAHNYITEGIHGDLKQGQRDRVMNSFRSNNVQILVATDVAARGLDIDDVEAVFNYDFPQEDEIYVHRIGRTGRAGRSGKSFTFITRRQQFLINKMEKYTNSTIVKGKVPTIDEIKRARSFSSYNLIKENLDNYETHFVHPVTDKLTSEGYTKDQIIQKLIDLVGKESNRQYKEIDDISNETDNRKKRERKDRRRDKKTRERNIEDTGNKRSRNKQRSEENGQIKNKVLVYLNVGTKNKIKIFDVFDLMNEVKIRKQDLGTIEINKNATYVELSERDANKVISKSNQLVVKDKVIQANIIK